MHASLSVSTRIRARRISLFERDVKQKVRNLLIFIILYCFMYIIYVGYLVAQFFYNLLNINKNNVISFKIL